ncbi:hypothetical protein FEDK69T_18690 [Flavobacterium enshiense DK69]|uniref:Uncharacterized protein n=1 Tax=Flavobacterium enshiense DK69 TaxID=1107311 RepID=V6S7C9_9FLAO|nr:hypothetical protein [Flavobacterium enshiense]ESU22613.1 hypothetical protein FEDK69T_18690 [Flavobacterium enshiense DK69]KGO95673.1 hypothetical protein Q767_10675 [Flavobacterium enshiense DK69]
MQIGNPSYKICPHCKHKNKFYPGPFHVKYYGLTEWSDGETFEELPNLKKTDLQKCDNCNQFYWFKKMLGGLSFEDYVEAADYFEKKYSLITISNIIYRSINRNRLLYIRLNILRKYNDQIRKHPLANGENSKASIPNEKKEIFINNIKLLLKLLNEIEPNNHLLIAELYRNIGDFEKARTILGKIPDSISKQLLLSEIEKRNCDVIIIQTPLIAISCH